MKYFKRLFLALLVSCFCGNAIALGTVKLGPQYFPLTTAGRPVSLGSVYVGQPDTDPSILANQKQLSVQQESGTIVAVTQPISTSAGGIPLYLGSPVTLLVEGTYSLKILDSSDAQIYYVPSTASDDSGTAQDACYPSYVAVDQGVTGDNNTLKYCIDTIGSDQATIVLRHNSGAATTTYTLTTSETIPANIKLKVERGAVIDGAGTLTITQPIAASSYGFTSSASAAVNDAAIAKALASSTNVYIDIPGTYSISDSITYASSNQALDISSGVILSYSGTSAAIKFAGVSNSKLLGQVKIACTNTSGTGISFEPTASAHCQYNYAEFHTIGGAGRSAAPDTYTGVGIEFEQINNGFIAYYNVVEGSRIADFDTGVKFDAPNGSAGNGANGNTVSIANMDNYWKGYLFLAIENKVNNTFFTGSPGSGAYYTYSFYFENTTQGNVVTNVAGEPGGLSRPYYFEATSSSNSISGGLWNYATSGIDLASANTINIGRDLYSGSQATGEELIEGTNYRIGRITQNNQKASVSKIRWNSRNTTTAYYSSGEVTLLAWAQGGSTPEIISSTSMESDTSFATKTAFLGVIQDVYDLYLVFQIRDRGGADANTFISIEVESSSTAEFSKTGPTVEAGALTLEITPESASHTVTPKSFTNVNNESIVMWTLNRSLVDDGLVAIPDQKVGFGWVMSDTGETMFFNTKADRTVAKISGTANTAVTDSDTDLCVFTSGSDVRIRNRLGATSVISCVYYYNE